MMTHRMRRGETLEMLSARYRVPVCMIAHINGVSLPRDICAGRVLKIPEWDYCLPQTSPQKKRPAYAAPVSFVTYAVMEGDSTYGIAHKFGLTMRILEAANGIDGDIRVGDVLKIPKLTGVRYSVRPGEGLSDIARRFGVAEARLCAINALTPGDLQAGMTLIIG